MSDTLVERDAKTIWHPYTPLLDSSPVAIARAEGELLFTENGEEIVDLISSWWVNIHGHNHPAITERIRAQMESLDHVIFAGFTHKPAVDLAEGLLRHLPAGQRRIFFSDNGSTAVEVAIKMAVQCASNRGQSRNVIAVLAGSYHGDTVGAMSVSERGVFTKAFSNLLFDVVVLPRPSTENSDFLTAVKSVANDSRVAAFLYEPIVQGAAGMYMYEASLLDQALTEFQNREVVCIADEVMTGFGRTGRWFASDYLNAKPDIVCLSKGITGGVLPLGVTSCNERIEAAFLTDDRSKTFFHGHSYTANPIACAAACASLALLEVPSIWEAVERISASHREAVNSFAGHERVTMARSCGTIFAADIRSGSRGYLDPVGKELYRKFLERGLLIRPLGNVIYLMPPYCVNAESLNRAYSAIREVVEEL